MLHSSFPQEAVLVDEEGTPLFHFLTVRSHPDSSDKGLKGIRLHLLMDAINPTDKSYSAWFHIVSLSSGQEWMIYDYFPDPHTDRWQNGQTIDFAPLIVVEPGRYKIEFGFWTENLRQRLYIENSSDYWIDLGEHEFVASLSND